MSSAYISRKKQSKNGLNFDANIVKRPLILRLTPFDTEHVIPSSKGGSDELENLAFSCGGCNGYKSNRTTWFDPVDGNEVPLFNPRIDKWDTHFTWSDDSTLVMGLTPTGRATILALKMNRNGLINLRSILTLVGEHPPNDD